MTPIRVLIADDQAEVREALQAFVSGEPGLELVGAAEDTDEAIALADRHRPDVALLDFKMPGGGGPRAAREIARLSPQTRVVALSAYEDRGSVFQMLRAGAVGYLVKGATVHEIREAIERAIHGEAVLSAEVTADVVHELAEQLERQSQIADMERERVQRIRRALEPGAFGLVFQPIVELESRRAVGFEALSRFWVEPSRPPDAWFAEAHESGLEVELEAAALRLAVGAVERLPDDAFVSANICPNCLASASIQAELEEADLTRVVLETTEHAQVEDYGVLRRTLVELRARGVRLAVDDAGAGFASLRHVLRLAPDMLKIDGAVIRGIELDRAARALTSALVAFARELDITVVAEGIESEGTLAVLAELGVHYGQGFAFGVPGELPEAA